MMILITCVLTNLLTYRWTLVLVKLISRLKTDIQMLIVKLLSQMKIWQICTNLSQRNKKILHPGGMISEKNFLRILSSLL